MKSRATSTRQRRRGARSQPQMHQITFCTSCEEAIPAHAMACFRCGARQPRGEKATQVVFCKRCQHDYPARALACHHCGQLNQRHPLIKGHIAS